MVMGHTGAVDGDGIAGMAMVLSAVTGITPCTVVAGEARHIGAAVATAAIMAAAGTGITTIPATTVGATGIIIVPPHTAQGKWPTEAQVTMCTSIEVLRM